MDAACVGSPGLVGVQGTPLLQPSLIPCLQNVWGPESFGGVPSQVQIPSVHRQAGSTAPTSSILYYLRSLPIPPSTIIHWVFSLLHA